ncbi:MAG: hypothetical protein RL693_2892 [Verrucomicrobiota bacterium]|jgi:hypothetical protein
MDVEDDNSSLMPPRAVTLEDLAELCRELNAHKEKPWMGIFWWVHPGKMNQRYNSR